MTGGTLALYARWHGRDALGRALIPVLMFAGIGGIPLWGIANEYGLEALRAAGPAHGLAVGVYRNTMTLAMTLGALVLLNGIVSGDREKQHYRFLFARPVVPWRYYLQAFAIAVALFTLCFAAIPVGMSLVVTRVTILPAIAAAALFAALFGALALLCSALVQRDGLLLVVVAVVSGILQQMQPSGMLPRWADLLATVLPPLGPADTLRSAWLAGEAWAWGVLLHVVGYAAGLLVAALLVIRRLPLAR